VEEGSKHIGTGEKRVSGRGIGSETIRDGKEETILAKLARARGGGRRRSDLYWYKKGTGGREGSQSDRRVSRVGGEEFSGTRRERNKTKSPRRGEEGVHRLYLMSKENFGGIPRRSQKTTSVKGRGVRVKERERKSSGIDSPTLRERWPVIKPAVMRNEKL